MPDDTTTLISFSPPTLVCGIHNKAMPNTSANHTAATAVRPLVLAILAATLTACDRNTPSNATTVGARPTHPAIATAPSRVDAGQRLYASLQNQLRSHFPHGPGASSKIEYSTMRDAEQKMFDALPPADVSAIAAYLADRQPSDSTTSTFDDVIRESITRRMTDPAVATEADLVYFLASVPTTEHGTFIEWQLASARPSRAIPILAAAHAAARSQDVADHLRSAFGRAFPQVRRHPDDIDTFVSDCTTYYDQHTASLVLNPRYKPSIGLSEPPTDPNVRQVKQPLYVANPER